MVPQNIPINGRIAIVDDQPEQALPIMNLFAKLQIPYVYYDSQATNLPDPESLYNDIRILFLDINLLDNSRRKDVELKSKLVGVLNRIISSENYPYLIIYWSREADEYNDLVQEIFDNDPLQNKKPIGFFSLNKQDYWSMDGTPTEDYEALIPTLFSRIEAEISKAPIYAHLLNWENQIHLSADKTLEEIFKLKNENDWNSDAGHLFYKLALAYAGRQIETLNPNEQVKSAFYSLNNVFADSLEYAIEANLKDKECTALEENKEKHNLTYVLNKKLLLSDDKTPVNAPGIVLGCESENEIEDFKALILGCLNMRLKTDEINNDNPELSNGQRRDLLREWKESIKQLSNNIYLVVTPVCDFAQNKYIFNKIVKGVKINASFRKYINTSEAIFVSPTFRILEADNEEVIILDFRHLYSFKEMPENGLTPLFRVRQQLLAEIQSKLSRHINRQGVLFLE
jgi:hypothetical protein